MPSTPKELIDIHTRHISYNERLKASNVKEYEKFLQQMSNSVKKRLSGTKPLTEYTVNRLNKLNANIEKDLRDIGDKVYEKFKVQASDLADYEAEFEIKSLNQVVEHSFTLPSTSQLNSAVFNTPLAQIEGVSQGKLLESFFKDFDDSMVSKIQGSIISGYYTGLTNNQIIQSIIGTKRMNFRDGDFAKKWRHMEATVRTGLQHAANQARQETWNRNSDIIKGVMWLATLDTRTSTICRSLDTKVYPVDSGPRPPAHVNCRSTTVAQLDDRFKILSEGRTRVARDPATGEVYSVNANTSYYDWLKAEPPSIQDSIIGPKRGKLLREGGLSASRFAELQIGKNFEPLTLKQMKALEPVAFQNAGVLENFTIDELLYMKIDADFSKMTPEQIATYKKNLTAYNKKVSAAKKSVAVANKQRIAAKKKLSALKKKKADPALIYDAEEALENAKLKVQERELKLKEITGEATSSNIVTVPKLVQKKIDSVKEYGIVLSGEESKQLGGYANKLDVHLKDIVTANPSLRTLFNNFDIEVEIKNAPRIGIDKDAVGRYSRTIQIAGQQEIFSELTVGSKYYSVGSGGLDTVRHEIGHYIYDKHMPKGAKTAWSKMSKNLRGSVSIYAKTNLEEGFAESFAAWSHPTYKNAKVLPIAIENFFEEYFEKNLGAKTITKNRSKDVESLLPSGAPFIDEPKFFKSYSKPFPEDLTTRHTDQLEKNQGSFKELTISELIPTQDYTGTDKVKKILNDFDINKAVVKIIEDDGKYYIYDGHHTAAGAVVAGFDKIKALVVEI